MTGSALVIGHSHVGAIIRAVKARKAALAPGETLNIEAVNRRHESFLPEFEKTLTGGEQINKNLLAMIKRTLRDPHGLIVSCIGGNQHNILGLARHDQPFDFVSPERPDLPIDDGAEMIPYLALKDVLAAQMKKEFKIIRRLSDVAKARLYHVESPPPHPSNELGAEYIANWTKQFGGRGAAPASLRLKVWRLHSSVVREFCESIGVPFIPVPAEALDANGYRVDAATNHGDPAAITHANAWYGELVLRQIDTLIAERTGAAKSMAS